MPLKIHISTNEYLVHFLLIMVSFLTYFIIFTPDKMLLIFSVITDIIFFMSTIEVKTQTRFMVLFTSRSLILGGNLQMPYLVSPPGICLLSTLNNQIPTSLQKSYDDQICLLLEQGGEVEERFGFPMGEF